MKGRSFKFAPLDKSLEQKKETGWALELQLHQLRKKEKRKRKKKDIQAESLRKVQGGRQGQILHITDLTS